MKARISIGNDLEYTTQEREDVEFKNYSILLHKGVSNQRQLEAIGDTINEAKLIMTTLNGLPRSWESFI
jgi:hypothetical protein